MSEFFSFFGKKKDILTNEERRNKAFFTLALYVLIGLFFLIVIAIGNLTNSNTDSNTVTGDLAVLNKQYEEIKNNNFNSNITILADDDIVLLYGKKESDSKEVITKKYRGQTMYYYKDDTNLWETTENFGMLLNQSPKDMYNNYDDTFLNINNIIKVLEEETSISLIEEEYNILRYKVDESKILNVYNEVNSTRIVTNDDFAVVIDVYYNESSVKINLNLTKFYNIIKNTNYNKVNYTIEYNDIGTIDLSNIFFE